MFLEDTKTRTSLKVGDIIVYDLNGGLISVSNNGRPKYLYSNDNKILIQIKDQFDVIEVINLIASVTNTLIENISTSGARTVPGYLFFEVKEVYEVPA